MSRVYGSGDGSRAALPVGQHGWRRGASARSCRANQPGPKWPGSGLRETGHARTGPQGAIWCGTGNSAVVSPLINDTI